MKTNQKSLYWGYQYVKAENNLFRIISLHQNKKLSTPHIVIIISLTKI